ncbi:MAG TPA: fatty acid desaturase [Rhizomicrobium sp.]|nr:fatty acid desaturase [Rhizomicrobium sp.]
MSIGRNSNVERAAPDARGLAQSFLRYREARPWRAVLELCLTAVCLLLGWAVMWLSLAVGYWLTLLLAIPTAGFLVRLFMIQHDCGHGAFFGRRVANDWIGRALGIFTFTPYDDWKRNHAIHHATSGNLDRRGTGDILTLTVEEYLARSSFSRFAYRVYRNPVVLFGIGPAYLFFLRHRLPLERLRLGWRMWASSAATNAGIAVVTAAMIWLVGIGPFAAVQLPVLLLAASIGVWLFYVQHQFEDVVWARNDDWSVHDAALSGSSHYDLPAVLRWFTANIGVHHVHHLCSRIPYYRLDQVLRDHPHLKTLGRVTLAQSLRSVNLTLWDETGKTLISFREAALARRNPQRDFDHAASATGNVPPCQKISIK